MTAVLIPWSTIECSQQAAWTNKRSLLVASRVKAFPIRPTNPDSTLPRAVHLEGGVVVVVVAESPQAPEDDSQQR